MAARFLRTSVTERISLLSGRCMFSSLWSPALFSTCCRKSEQFQLPPPPAAKKVPFTATARGVNWQDPYRWMSDIKDPDFINYLNEENSYADAFMRDTEELQESLYSEMVSRMPSKISTPPERWGPWLYYQCVPEEKEYPVLCRKPAIEKNGWVNRVFRSFGGGFGREQVLLDWNEIAEKHGYVHVGTCRVSPDHNFLAYTLDTTGNELFQLQVKDLRNNNILPQPRVEGVISLAWAQDSCTLFYTICDQNQRPYRVSCTNLGTHDGDDAIILTENDSRFCLDITSTKDGMFVTVNSNSRTSSEVYIIDATNPQRGLQKFCRRVPGVQYFLEHHCNFFYVLTNAPTSNSKNFSNNGYYLARCRDVDAQLANLKNIIMPGEGVCLEDMDIFHGHLVLFLNRMGSTSICSINMPIDLDCEVLRYCWNEPQFLIACEGVKMLAVLHQRNFNFLCQVHKKEMEIDDLNPWYFPLPSNMCTITPGSNHDFKNTVYRAVLSSPVTPDLLVDYDMSRKTFSIVQQEDVRNIPSSDAENCSPNSDNDPSNENGWNNFSEKYICEVKEVVSHDGVKIPLTVLFSRSAYQGASPGLLHGYGAYGEVLDKSWCSDRLSLLDQGWIFAFADVRGGAGADPSWHKSGRGLNKLNSIHDFVSCGEYLIKEGFINKNELTALGISAGCILVGAAINMRPELFRAVILKVPFLDVLNTLLDPTLPLTTIDYEEFGNPEEQSYFEHILKYSPYDNIPPGVCCPSMLVAPSFNDSRVGVWEAAKWVAKIRDTACPGCSPSVILKTDMRGGHFREGGRYAHCLETAYDYAFLMKVIQGN